ncbi:MAG: hypothetical protein N2578_05675, partial [Bdellovibrionaceae bacterium]|nr:hypothetical protein [Pseudobdellovibrionaceae bacterium]
FQGNVNTYFGNQFGLGWDWGNNISNIVFSRSRLAFEVIVGYTPWGIRRPNAATGEASEAYARFSTAGVRLVIN